MSVPIYLCNIASSCGAVLGLSSQLLLCLLGESPLILSAGLEDCLRGGAAVNMLSGMVPTSSLPELVVFDLDWTIWPRPRFRAGPPWTSIDNGLGGVRARSGECLDLYPGARKALLHLVDAGVPIALASRTHRPRWAIEWMDRLRISPERTLASVAVPVVLRDGSKAIHVREIVRRRHPLIPLNAILFFDDNRADVLAVERLGCTACHCPHREGVTDAVFDRGLMLHAEKLRSAVADCAPV